MEGLAWKMMSEGSALDLVYNLFDSWDCEILVLRRFTVSPSVPQVW